ncbi:MAG: hypothetical protein ACKO7B_06390, partial [Flavobacteriales bacterium]
MRSRLLFGCLFTLLLLIMGPVVSGVASRFTASDWSLVFLDNMADTVQPSDDLGLEFPVEYMAEDSTVVDVLNERILLYGKARVVYGEMEVAGDFIAFSLTDFTAKAAGKRDSLGNIIERATFK